MTEPTGPGARDARGSNEVGPTAEHRARRAATLIAVLTVAFLFSGGLLLAADWAVPVPASYGFRGFTALLGSSFAAVGAVIASRRPRNPIGWAFAWAGLVGAFLFFAYEYAVRDMIVAPNSLPGGTVMAWILSWLWIPGIAPSLFVLLLLFPDGHLPSRRWRPLLILTPVVLAFSSIAVAISPGPLQNFPAIDNPFGLQGWPKSGDRLNAILATPLYLLLFAACPALVVRWRRARDVERQQLKWLAFAGALLGLATLAEFLAILLYLPVDASSASPNLPAPIFIAELAWIGCLLLIPVAAGIAIQRYRLYEIDVLINRTFVYGALTAILAGLYAASIKVFQTLFVGLTGDESDAAVVITTLVLVSTFTPIKNRLERLAERRLKGARRADQAESAALTDRLLADPTFRAALENAVARAVADGAPASSAIAGSQPYEETPPTSIAVEPA